MKHFHTVLFLGLASLAPAAFAQKWEVGVAGGGSFSTTDTFKNPAGNADGGFSAGPAVSAWLGNNTGNFMGGEFRYDYERTDLKLSSGGTTVNFGAHTNAVHYDFLMHFAPTESPVRPFIAAGGGVKLFTGTGSEQVYQPLSNIALLTKTNQIEPVISIGGGVKFSVSKSVEMRLEAHDYLSPFPKNVIAPAFNSTVSGWLNDFVVSAGLSFGY